jgi:hypothetical protein
MQSIILQMRIDYFCFFVFILFRQLTYMASINRFALLLLVHNGLNKRSKGFKYQNFKLSIKLNLMSLTLSLTLCPYCVYLVLPNVLLSYLNYSFTKRFVNFPLSV